MIFSILVLGLPLLVAGRVLPRELSPPITIDNLASGGSGCPQSVKPVSKVFDSSHVEVAFLTDTVRARTGPGTSILDERKNCQMNVLIHSSEPNLQYSISSLSIKGIVKLAANVTALSKSIIYFSGDLPQLEYQTEYSGPVSKEFEEVYKVPAENAIWSACNAPTGINVNNQVRVAGDRGSAGDILHGEAEPWWNPKTAAVYRVGLAWRECPDAEKH